MKHRNRGFTLLEVLIAMALVAVLSALILSSLAPWIAFRQKMETQTRMVDLAQGLKATFDNNAFRIAVGNDAETFEYRAANGTYATFAKNGDLAAESRCDETASLSGMSGFLTQPPDEAQFDGFRNVFCFAVSQPLVEQVDSDVPLYYRVVAVISPGRNGQIDEGTEFNATTGVLQLGGDDLGETISSLPFTRQKYRDTVARLDRVAQAFEQHFTVSYLANAARDLSVYYFDPEGEWSASATTPIKLAEAPDIVLADGSGREVRFSVPQTFGQSDLASAYETILPAGDASVPPNWFVLSTGSLPDARGNTASANTSGRPPFTLLLGAPFPAQGGGTRYIVRTVVGAY